MRPEPCPVKGCPVRTVREVDDGDRVRLVCLFGEVVVSEISGLAHHQTPRDNGLMRAPLRKQSARRIGGAS